MSDTDSMLVLAKKSLQIARRTAREEIDELLRVKNNIDDAYARNELDWADYQQYVDSFAIVADAMYKYERAIGMIRIPKLAEESTHA